MRLTKRRGVAWIAGAAFTASAVLTEAVSGVVGIADVLGATGTLMALLALTLPLGLMFFGGHRRHALWPLFEGSALCCVPLIPLGALLLSPNLHPKNPQRAGSRAFYPSSPRAARSSLRLHAALGVPTTIPNELSAEANAHKPFAGRVFAGILRWYAQPILPKDPLNNPLVNADAIHRIGGALSRCGSAASRRWSSRGRSRATTRHRKSHSNPLVAGIVLGAILLLALPPLAIWLGLPRLRALESCRPSPPRIHQSRPMGPAPPSRLRCARPIHAHRRVRWRALWAMISYFPVSNIPVLLPTVRAGVSGTSRHRHEPDDRGALRFDRPRVRIVA